MLRFAVDVDGVMFDRADYPNLGKPNWDIISTCQELQRHGHKVYMFTSREGKALEILEEKLREIDFMFDPYEFSGKKVRADFYVDDRAIQPSTFPRIVESFLLGMSISDRWGKE